MFKRNIVAGIIGIVLTGGYLAFLCVWLKAPPLIIICVVVMGLAIYDFWLGMKDISDNREL